MIRAFYDGNIRMPFPKENMSGKDLERYITNEYTHAAVSAKTLGKCPVWLSEGIAMMESYRDDPQAPFPAFSGSAESTRISLGMIADAFDGKNDAVMDIGTYYILADRKSVV